MIDHALFLSMLSDLWDLMNPLDLFEWFLTIVFGYFTWIIVRSFFSNTDVVEDE